MRMPHLMASFTITALYVWTMLVACQSLFAHVLASVCILGWLTAKMETNYIGIFEYLEYHYVNPYSIKQNMFVILDS